MSAGHMPGPWVLGVDDHGFTSLYASEENGGDLIAHLYGEDADYPLIAAAPELLEAAQKALNFIANTEGELGITLDSGDALRAAIAKATGAA